MRVRKLREYLETAAKASPSNDQEVMAAVNDLVIGLGRYDRDSVEKVLDMFALVRTPAAGAALPTPREDAAEELALQDLQDAFDDDVAFRSVLDRLKNSRSVSREGLNRVYCKLFGKVRSISSKTTKAKVVQDIADLRLERVRSRKAVEFFAAK